MIEKLLNELENMRGDLIQEQLDELKKQNLGLSDLELDHKAKDLVEKLIKTVQNT